MRREATGYNLCGREEEEKSSLSKSSSQIMISSSLPSARATRPEGSPCHPVALAISRGEDDGGVGSGGVGGSESGGGGFGGGGVGGGGEGGAGVGSGGVGVWLCSTNTSNWWGTAGFHSKLVCFPVSNSCIALVSAVRLHAHRGWGEVDGFMVVVVVEVVMVRVEGGHAGRRKRCGWVEWGWLSELVCKYVSM